MWGCLVDKCDAFIFNYTCVYIPVCSCVCVGVHMSVEARGQSQVSSLGMLSVFSKTGSLVSLDLIT